MSATGSPKPFILNHDRVYYAEHSLTDVGRAMRELSVERIFANSPHAKGRVECGNRTHQDRLIKALRRERVSTISDTNRFLEKVYLKEHNARFASTDGLPDVHRPADGYDLKNIFCHQMLRVVRHDLDGVFVQLEQSETPLPPPRQYVTVRRHLDGSLHITWNEHELRYTPLSSKPRKAYYHATPSKDHPWRLQTMSFKKKRKQPNPYQHLSVRRPH